MPIFSVSYLIHRLFRGDARCMTQIGC